MLVAWRNGALLVVWAVCARSDDEPIPAFDNTCWDNDPNTFCPVSKEANNRYTSLAMEGGRAPPHDVPRDGVCRRSERHHTRGGSNASACLEALRHRKWLDEAELRAKNIVCTQTAALMHTWWDGPLLRVVALFLRSFRGTQHPTCAKLVVWTPRRGTERSTPEGARWTTEIEGMSGAPVVFQPLPILAMAKGTLFEKYVKETVLPHSWATEKVAEKKEGTRHFSDFFQLFVLWRYGGVYFDADQVLVRDLYPLWGLNFEYQWSFMPEKFNNAVQGLGRGEGEGLIRQAIGRAHDQCCKGWGTVLWNAKAVKSSNSYGLPCMSFDPYWLRMDGHHTGELGRPSLHYPGTNRDWLFKANYAVAKDWYDGAFGIHWHGGAGGPGGGNANVWEPNVATGSYVEHWEEIWS